MPDAKIIDDTPNVVIDEEGFIAATFRFDQDARDFVNRVNRNHPCAGYSIETVAQRAERLKGEE